MHACWWYVQLPYNSVLVLVVPQKRPYDYLVIRLEYEIINNSYSTHFNDSKCFCSKIKYGTGNDLLYGDFSGTGNGPGNKGVPIFSGKFGHPNLARHPYMTISSLSISSYSPWLVIHSPTLVHHDLLQTQLGQVSLQIPLHRRLNPPGTPLEECRQEAIHRIKHSISQGQEWAFERCRRWPP